MSTVLVEAEIFEKYVRMEEVIISVRQLSRQRETMLPEQWYFGHLDAAMAQLERVKQIQEQK